MLAALTSYPTAPARRLGKVGLAGGGGAPDPTPTPPLTLRSQVTNASEVRETPAA